MEHRTSGASSEHPTWGRLFLRGLSTSAGGNSQAFGFSITITVTYGIASSEGTPTTPELLAFAMAAVAAFSLVNVVVARLLHDEEAGTGSSRVVMLATATDFFAVGAGICAALGARALLGGWAVWVGAPLLAGLAYVIVQSVELTVGQRETG